MKKLMFSLLLLTGSLFFVNAQNTFSKDTKNKTVISTRPLSLVLLQPNLKVEQAFGTNFTGGAELTLFTKVNKGFRVDPFLRFYTNKSGAAPEGFYFQGKFSYGNHKELINEDIITTGVNKPTESFNAIGGGFGIGSQWFAGANNNFSIDFYGGVRRYAPIDPDNQIESAAFKVVRGWPAELRFGLGYAF